MSEEKSLFKSESKIDVSMAAEVVNRVAEGLMAGMITLENGKNIDLKLPQEVTLEVEVEDEGKTKTKKRSLEIEIEWLVNEE